jgi:hypothetical protein
MQARFVYLLEAGGSQKRLSSIADLNTSVS